jgi:glycosyltransferase involved in cell wall biosynthesis
MRILQLAPLWEAVPPPAYGGTEAVVSTLCEELVRQGHDVTLCASGDSQTSATLSPIYYRSLRTAASLSDRSPYDWMHVALSLREARDFDVIHNHAGELAMAMSHLVDVPMLTTMHCLITPDTKFVWDRYPGWYNTISHSQRRHMPPIRNGNFLGVVYNAIDVASFPYSEHKDDFLLFLSRVAPEKGVHLAIEVAKRLGRTLIIAAKVDRVDQRYFETAVEPQIDGRLIRFVGEADAHRKRDLLARARCLLLPLCWEEPFGLVMAEAMACGTPVVAFRRGSAPELIADGETGFLVDGVEGMASAVLQVDHIDPKRCRRHVEERFTPERMTADYLSLYERIRAETLEEPVPPPVRVSHATEPSRQLADGWEWWAVA